MTSPIWHEQNVSIVALPTEGVASQQEVGCIMPQQATEQTEAANTEAMLDDTAEASTLSGTSRKAETTEDIASNPEVLAALDKAFGSLDEGASTATVETPAAEGDKPTRRSSRRTEEEEVEELEGLEADEIDDGAEPQDRKAEEKEGTDSAATKTDTDDGKEDDSGEAETSTLSPVLREAAKRAGMTEEAIDALYKTTPEGANKSFSNLLRSFNDLSAEYGRMGERLMRSEQGDDAPAPRNKPSTRPQQRDSQESSLAKLYGAERLAELKDKYGADYIEDVLPPLVNAMMGPVHQMQAQLEHQQSQGVADEVGKFFSGLGDEYESLYGKGNEVTGEQIETRQKLGLMADHIRRGAQEYGFDLSVIEALQKANLMLSAEHLSTIERKKITAAVKKRSRKITQRPSQRQRQAHSDQSETSAIAAYTKKAADLGVDVREE